MAIEIRHVKCAAVTHRATYVDRLCFRGKPWILTGYVGTVCKQVCKD
jgi:hypothetical protein